MEGEIILNEEFFVSMIQTIWMLRLLTMRYFEIQNKYGMLYILVNYNKVFL